MITSMSLEPIRVDFEIVELISTVVETNTESNIVFILGIVFSVKIDWDHYKNQFFFFAF